MNMFDFDCSKLKYHQVRLDAWNRGVKIAPVTIDWALTRKCNYNCVYCYSKLQKNDEKKITLDVITNFIDDCSFIGVKGISLISDGESTCHENCNEAILYGKSKDIDMALGTNGYFLKDIETILSSLIYLRFNISAALPEIYAEIHGCNISCYDKVIENIKEAVAIKKKLKLKTTIGLQMVLLPEYADQIIPLAKLGKELDVDYLVIKHCSDDEHGKIGVKYDEYFKLVDLLKEAEGFTDETYQVQAKWSKLLSGGKREYCRCYAPPFMLQISGSGLVAPCGMLFNEKYKDYHIGNIAEQRFLSIWRSEKYWQVMNKLASDKFDAHTMCGTLCLQHKTNEYLWSIKNEKEPEHVNFI